MVLRVRKSKEITELGIYLALYCVSNIHLDMYTLCICICCYIP